MCVQVLRQSSDQVQRRWSADWILRRRRRGRTSQHRARRRSRPALCCRQREQEVNDHMCSQNANKAVTDRRLRPRCCHLGSYFKRPKSSPVRPLACNWYCCAQFLAKPQAACALRFSWAASRVEQPWLMSKHDVIHKPEVHNISLRRQTLTEPRP